MSKLAINIMNGKNPIRHLGERNNPTQMLWKNAYKWDNLILCMPCYAWNMMARAIVKFIFIRCGTGPDPIHMRARKCTFYIYGMCCGTTHSITNKQNTHLWIAVAPGLDDCVYYIPLPHLHLNLVSYFVYIHTSECVWLFISSFSSCGRDTRALARYIYLSPCVYTVWLCIYAYSSIRLVHIWCAILGHTVCRSEDATRRRYNGFIFLFSFFSFRTCVCLSGFDRHLFLTLHIVHSFTCTSHSLYRTILIHLPFHFRLWLFINKLVLFNSKFNESNRIVSFSSFCLHACWYFISFPYFDESGWRRIKIRSDAAMMCVSKCMVFSVSSTVWRIRYHINTGVITPKLNSLLSINFFISCLSRYPSNLKTPILGRFIATGYGFLIFWENIQIDLIINETLRFEQNRFSLRLYAKAAPYYCR